MKRYSATCSLRQAVSCGPKLVQVLKMSAEGEDIFIVIQVRIGQKCGEGDREDDHHGESEQGHRQQTGGRTSFAGRSHRRSMPV